MRRTLTESEIARYRTAGFVVVEDFLDALDLECWREAFDGAVRRRASVSPGRPGASVAGASDETRRVRSRIFDQRLHVSTSSRALRSVLLESSVGDIARQLTEAADAYLWWDQAIIKPPYGIATPPHVDGPAFATNDPRVFSLWVALDDATTSSGCLFYLPGTHLAGSTASVPMGWRLDELFDHEPEWRSIEPVMCPVPAGGAIIHSGFVAHGATPNFGASSRRAHSMIVVPGDATFDRLDFAGQFAWPEGSFDGVALGSRLGDLPLLTALVPQPVVEVG